jgi:UDP-glucose 4-epimerase
VLNIASGKETTIKDLVSKIGQLMKSNIPVVYAKPRPGDVRRFYGSNLLAKKIIGYQPNVGLEEGLTRTIKWYSDLFKSKES